MRGEIAELRQQIESLRLAGMLTVAGFEEQQKQFENHSRQLHFARLHAESVTKLLEEQGDNLLLQHLLLQSVLSRVETVEQLAVATGRALAELRQDVRELSGRVEGIDRKLDAHIAWAEQDLGALTVRVDAHDAGLECVQKRTACHENAQVNHDKENADATRADVQVTG